MELDIHSMIHEVDQHLSDVQAEVMTCVVLKDHSPESCLHEIQSDAAC
jgi:hypothetical protein